MTGYTRQRGSAILAAIALVIVFGITLTRMTDNLSRTDSTQLAALISTRAELALQGAFELASVLLLSSNQADKDSCTQNYTLDGFTIQVTCTKQSFVIDGSAAPVMTTSMFQEGANEYEIYRISLSATAEGQPGQPGFTRRTTRTAVIAISN